MSIREKFQSDLDELKNSLLELGTLAEVAMIRAIDSLKHQDLEEAKRIITDDYKINELEKQINERAILLIMKQAPVASDLRRIVTVLKVSSDLERVGDLAVNIAKSVEHMGSTPFLKKIEDIPLMASLAQKMLANVLDAYYKEDTVLANTTAKLDDEIDELYGSLIQELLELMAVHPKSISQITQLAFICRYIERIADHATNISESTIYLVRGEQYRLNA
ncbi:phosphate signaling complex protein PhoU [Bacillus taeanensis]|uniref:Phosphate-specific transport system accessory protein PhoU n=1 Tax=Bacillus taeanensis TaxID=273032 RepID=A0A366XYD1_9BACI|nr:phosphate signaling complex protein PhoU [Bacillus taeanensis]RBW70907.1 phosphate transport system regulatory protein PhoU [Bacillus taeanensis]